MSGVGLATHAMSDSHDPDVPMSSTLRSTLLSACPAIMRCDPRSAPVRDRRPGQRVGRHAPNVGGHVAREADRQGPLLFRTLGIVVHAFKLRQLLRAGSIEPDGAARL